MSKLLEIKNITVSAENKEILHDISLTVEPGETHVLMGPNGAGKSTLGHAVMGSPEYAVTGGNIFFEGEDITNESPDKRARRGIFLSFQDPVEVAGISLSNFIRTCIVQNTGKRIKVFAFRKELEKMMELLNMDSSYADRDLNVGFSGGEKKKAEILQLLMLNPKLAILDETDSGLDVDAVRTVSEGIREFQRSRGGALLIITHSTRILSSLHVDKTHVLTDGKIVTSGGAELVEQINKGGFEKYTQMSDDR